MPWPKNTDKITHPTMPVIRDDEDVLVMCCGVLGMTDWSVVIVKPGVAPRIRDVASADARQLIRERGLVKVHETDSHGEHGWIYDTPDMRGRQCYPLGIIMLGADRISVRTQPKPVVKPAEKPKVLEQTQDAAELEAEGAKFYPDGRLDIRSLSKSVDRVRALAIATGSPETDGMPSREELDAMSREEFIQLLRRERVKHNARRYYAGIKSDTARYMEVYPTDRRNAYNKKYRETHLEEINSKRREKYRNEHPKK